MIVLRQLVAWTKHLLKYSPEHFYLLKVIKGDANNTGKLSHKTRIVTENIAYQFHFQTPESGRPLLISITKPALVELVPVEKVILLRG